MTTPEATQEIQKATFLAVTISNRILMKLLNAPNQKAIHFIILNDTYHAFPFDRAILVRWGDLPKVLGVSGQHQEGKRSELPEKWLKTIKDLVNPATPQIFEESSFKENTTSWKELQTEIPGSRLWIPLLVSGHNGIGIWIERWQGGSSNGFAKEQIELLQTFLIPGYTEALKKDTNPFKGFLIGKFLKQHWGKILTGILLLTLIIRVPLRIVAPSEVVPKKPIVIAAPIEGIIAEVLVRPGQAVEKGEILVEYDKRIFEQEYKGAQKETQIAQAELNRGLTLGLHDEKSLVEVSELELKLEKAKIRQKLIEVQLKKLTVQAPENGVVIMQNPEEWRGKPVRVGEKIVTLGNPKETQVKAWISEADNIPVDLETTINVYLNVSPEKSLPAKITFIANESVLNEAQIPSFIAEADWTEKNETARLGLKGTAVIYGESVSLLYYILRKPISSFRRITGL